MECNEEYLPFITELTKQFYEVPSMRRPAMNRDITCCVERFLKPQDIKDILLFVENQGKKVYIFSSTILMVVERADEGTNINRIRCYPLKRTEYCELEMTREKDPSRNTKLQFKIGNEPFALLFADAAIVNMAGCLEDIVTKILTNING